MKNLFLSIIFLLGSTLWGYTQDVKEISVSKLPKPAVDYIKQTIPDSKIVKAVTGMQNGTVYYAAVAEGRGRKFSMVFDKNGNFLQKVDDLTKINLQSQTMGGSSASSSTAAAGSGKPEGYRDLPLQSCPPKVQQYIKTKHPDGKVISSGQYTQKGQGFFLVVVNDKNLNYNLHFSSKGDYMPSTSKITPANPTGSAGQKQPTPPVQSKRKAPGSESATQEKK